MRERKRRLWHASPYDGQPGIWAAFRRLLYQFEGAAQLGDPNEPAGVTPANPTCPVCHALMADHQIVRGGPGKPTHLNCPPPVSQAPAAAAE
ncbi:hypothetical protein JOF28_000203 [Leucobacter exalbidus]|uniref:Uncharacterized protein n=1 Tax=Leucobacter exalbidus TaxID=662960 RepID=A0A940PVI6_9MICO|nr:hypothetical protein [Leucobacter exalbidus]